MKRTLHYERMRPWELRRALEESPVAYIPLGALEFHGWHLPLGYDALKAHEICLRAAAQTGGAVLPPAWHGYAGGLGDAFGSIPAEEEWVLGCLRRTCERLADTGFRVLVVLTGHYPEEQVAGVKNTAREITSARPGLVVMALSEAEAYPTEFRGDHAAKWETSIAMHLFPEMVELKRMERHDDPLCGVRGDDPRETASARLGRETVDCILEVLTAQVREALRGGRPKPPWWYGNVSHE